MPTVKLTSGFVKIAGVEPGKDRTIWWDEDLPGFGLRVTKTGAKSYVVGYRHGIGRGGTDRLMTLKRGLKHDDARREAKAIQGRVAKGNDVLQQRRDAAAKATGTLQAITESYFIREGGMTRHDDGTVTFAEGRKLRSAPERLKTFERLIYPVIGSKPIGDIKRSDIVRLLDKIEHERGAQAAQQALAFLSKTFSGYASRNDDFSSPIVRGMGRVKVREHTRERTLDDQEIRDIWAATESSADGMPAFNRLLRTLLLTGLRRNEAARLAWREIEHLKRDDFAGFAAVIPAGRMKGKVAHVAPLVATVLDIIGERPADAKRRPFVFSLTDGSTALSSFSRGKQMLDRRIAELRKADGREPMPEWRLHDLRRSARSFLSRARVEPHIAERVLAHTVGGVQGVYDKWGYLPEKLDALQRLAALIGKIIKPPPTNVVTFPSAATA
jgi:integrase